MTITDQATTEQDQRAAAIAGLHELADFLAEHPGVPLPRPFISGGYRNPKPLAEWIDGLDEIEIEAGFTADQRKVVRTFAGLSVALVVDAGLVGEVREVPGIVTELVHFTPDEIRSRSAAREAVQS